MSKIISISAVAFVSTLTVFSQSSESLDEKEKKVVDLQPIVVTTQREEIPLKLELDASAAIQPIPAQDGADFLKHIPGFSIIRKGGIDGDPVLRGVGGSRLSVSVDGETILGGCGQRMDPPTAYVFPTSFDRVIITKGPQTVMHGPGNSAGVVRFERDLPHPTDVSTSSGNVYSNIASFGRFDLGASYRWQGEKMYTRLNGTHSTADDYETGKGISVHSGYERWSLGATAGWMMDEESNLEVSVNTSDGEASYADRLMDGVKFARENVATRYYKEMNTGILERVEAQVYYNYVDHVMDNHSLRVFTPNKMMPNPTVSNPDRLTYGGKTIFYFNSSEMNEWALGVDFQINEHSVRKTMNQSKMPYEVMDRIDDATFKQAGVFVESEMILGEDWTLVWGGRADFWYAEDLRKAINVMMVGPKANPTSGADRSQVLPSGFVRIEHPLKDDWGQWYAGVGYVSRFPDYWELFSKESTTTLSAFETDEESILQVDVGWLLERENVAVSVSAFAAKYDNFILIQSAYAKAGMAMNRMATVSRNVDATTHGLEASLLLRGGNGLYSSASLAYVKGENTTDDLPLAQIPPLEGRIELGYRSDTWSAGFLTRLVDAQDRFSKNQGNIVGQDIGPSDGFAVFSVHGSYRVNESFALAAGVDNLLDEAYAEHLSRAGGAVAGFTQTTRVNEPGRVIWLRADLRF